MIYQNNDFESHEMKIQCEFGYAIRELQSVQFQLDEIYIAAFSQSNCLP